MAAPNHLNLQFLGIQCLLLVSAGIRNACGTYTKINHYGFSHKLIQIMSRWYTILSLLHKNYVNRLGIQWYYFMHGHTHINAHGHTYMQMLYLIRGVILKWMERQMKFCYLPCQHNAYKGATPPSSYLWFYGRCSIMEWNELEVYNKILISVYLLYFLELCETSRHGI